MQNSKCLNPNHQSKEIIFVCMNKDCQFERVCCIQCEDEDHINHSNQLIDFYLMNCFFEILENNNDSQYKEHLQFLEQIKNSIDKVNAVRELKYFSNNLEQYTEEYNHIQQKCECYYHFSVAIQLCALTEIYLEITLADKYKNLTNCFRDIINCQCVSKFQNKNQQYIKFEKQPIEIDGNKRSIVRKNKSAIVVRNLEKGRLQILDFFQAQQLVQPQPLILLDIDVVDRVYFIVQSKNNQFIALGFENKTQIYKINEMKSYQTFIKMEGIENRISEFIFSEDCQLALLNYRNKVKIWSLSLKKLMYWFTCDLTIIRILISQDNKLIACQCMSPTFIQILDIQQRKKVINQPTSYLFESGFCASKDFSIFMAGKDKEIKIWKMIYSNSSQQSQLTLFKTIQVSNSLHLKFKNCITKSNLTRDQKYLVLMFKIFGQIKIIEIESGKIIQQFYTSLSRWNDENYLSFTDDLSILCTGLVSKKNKVWKRIIQNEK